MGAFKQSVFVIFGQYVQLLGATSATTLAQFGRGSGPIFLDDVLCIGTEDRLLDCNHTGTNNHNCGHSEDAGVVCQKAGT